MALLPLLHSILHRRGILAIRLESLFWGAGEGLATTRNGSERTRIMPPTVPMSLITVAATTSCILKFEADSHPRPAEHARSFFNHCLGMSIRHTLLGRRRMAAAEGAFTRHNEP